MIVRTSSKSVSGEETLVFIMSHIKNHTVYAHMVRGASQLYRAVLPTPVVEEIPNLLQEVAYNHGI